MTIWYPPSPLPKNKSGLRTVLQAAAKAGHLHPTGIWNGTCAQITSWLIDLRFQIVNDPRPAAVRIAASASPDALPLAPRAARGITATECNAWLATLPAVPLWAESDA